MIMRQRPGFGALGTSDEQQEKGMAGKAGKSAIGARGKLRVQ